MLVHVTSVGFAREIIRAGQLEARHCKIFLRDLIYFFVLRPAYKLRGGEDKQSLIDFFPFVFLVRPDNIGPPFHVYPFDTGGAVSGAFDEGASDAFFLEDYELKPDLQSISDHIAWAFDGRLAYYDGKLKPGFVESFAHWNVGPISFGNIAGLASEGSNRPDLRASSIEVAFQHHVPLSEVVRVILPRQFLEDPRGNNTEIIDALNAEGVEWDTYEWMPNRAPADFQTEINQMVRSFLEDQALL